MVDLDLNMPAAGEDDFDPPFCTQPAFLEAVEESPDPINVGNLDDEGSGRGPHHNLNPPHTSNPSVPATTAPTTTTTHPGQAEEVNEEVASTPQEPFLGMRFDTIADARAHYNAYALRLGFSIKSNTSKRAAWTNELEKQQFVCNKNRAPKTEEQIQKERLSMAEQVSPVQIDSDAADDDEAGPSKKRSGSKKSRVRRKRESIKQTKCPAKMIVKFINNKWEVTYFIAEHNHPMIEKPSLKKYLRSHKGIPPDEKQFLRCLHDCNLETGRMMTVMSSFYGLEGFVPYEPKDITNLRHSFRTADQEYDIEETIGYFMELQENDPEFFYKVSKDEENRVENIFWVDSAARKAYAEAYHDCVSFDTTFMTNHFNMPFAPFIGINRHGQSFMLGCGFMRDEKEEAFRWMFEAFLEAMDGRQPGNIITDQDRAMANAIAAIFPDTVHRNCRWHIMKKANEKLGPYLGRHPVLAEDFNEVIDESMSPEEFEARWAEMVEKWELRGHETFAWLKKYAHTWVPCYFRTRFFPFLQSTQRSEGFNSVLKRYVNPQNSIKHFVKQYEKIQQMMLCREGHNDFNTDELVLDPSTSFPIEKHAMAVYTRPIYHRFVMEFEMIGRYNVQPQGQNMYICVPNNLRCYPYGSRSYMVNTNGGNFNCECCKFERDGILCCHVQKIFIHLGVDAIPQRYISHRWTQDALSSVVMPGVAGQNDGMPKESREHIRFANLSRDFVGIAKLGCKSDQAEAIARRHIREMRTEFAQLNKVRRKKASKTTNNQNTIPSTQTCPTAVASHQTGSRANQPSTSVPDMPRTTNSVRMPPPTVNRANQTSTSVPSMPRSASAVRVPARTVSTDTEPSALVPSTPRLASAAQMVTAVPRYATGANVQEHTGVVTDWLSTPVGLLRQSTPIVSRVAEPNTTRLASASQMLTAIPRSAQVANVQQHTGVVPDWLSTPVGLLRQSTATRQMQPMQQMPSSSWQTNCPTVFHQVGPSAAAEAAGALFAQSLPCPSRAMNVPRPRAKRTLSGASGSGAAGASGAGGAGASAVQHAEPMVVLNPPRSNTKGRKKGRYLGGIELQPKRINLCGTCGNPGHNSATCTAALGNRKPDGAA